MHVRSMRRMWMTAAVTVVMGCGGSEPVDGPPDGGPGADASVDARPSVDASPTPQRPRYNAVRQKSSHNSFQRHEALLDQMIYHRIRSLELDIHKRKGLREIDGDWFVYHTVLDGETTCHRLSDCLDELAAFDRAIPDHEVVTVWLDIEAFDDTHTPADLDALLTATLSADDLVTPAQLMRACPGAMSLTQAVTGDCGWPDLDAIRGRFLFALTGGDVQQSNTPLSTYLDQGGEPHARLAFVAPDLTRVGDLQPPSPDSNVVFYNMNVGNAALARDVHAAGYVGRVWEVNSEANWHLARDASTHHLATDKINAHQDAWSRTHLDSGWPFECIESCAAQAAEPSALIALDVDSGDIWNRADQFLFAHTTVETGAAGFLSAYVSTVNSHVDEWAKGCLMARAALDDDAPYFAVCRPADRHRLRVQMRTTAGADSEAVEHAITPADTVDPESVTFVRLELDAEKRCAIGLGSQNGVDWVPIAQQCFAQPLLVVGLAGSGHDSEVVRFIFGNVSMGADWLSIGAFDAITAIGSVASGDAFDLSRSTAFRAPASARPDSSLNAGD